MASSGASTIDTRKGRLSYSQYAQVFCLETGLATRPYRAKQVYVLSMGGGSWAILVWKQKMGVDLNHFGLKSETGTSFRGQVWK